MRCISCSEWASVVVTGLKKVKNLGKSNFHCCCYCCCWRMLDCNDMSCSGPVLHQVSPGPRLGGKSVLVKETVDNHLLEFL